MHASFIVPGGEEIDAHLQFVFYGGDLLIGDCVADLLETLFCDEAVVPDWANMIFGPGRKGTKDRITKGAVVCLLFIDDRMLQREELWQLTELEACEMDEFHKLEI